MGGVFLNYRRQDSAGHAGRIFDHLTNTFGKHQVFRDIDAIDPGRDFAEVIDQRLKSSVAILVLIGPDWQTIESADGTRRLHEPSDFVRIEIERAIERDLHLIPVLLPGVTKEPKAEELPDSIKRMARRQALRLTEETWEAQLEKLVELLDRLGVQPLPRKPSKPARRGLVSNLLMGLGALFLVAIIVGMFTVPPTPPGHPPIDDPPTELPLTFENVSTLQQGLAALGVYHGRIDGKIGPQTRAAIRDFQQHQGQEPDGLLTAPLLAQLDQTGRNLGSQASTSLSGTWYDNNFVRYELQQSGDRLSARSFDNWGNVVAQFTGAVSGNQIDYQYQYADGTTGSGSGNLQADNIHIDTLSTDAGAFASETNQLHRGHQPR